MAASWFFQPVIRYNKMSNKYDLTTVTDTHNRLSDPDLTERQMETELETPSWIPELDRMIVLADSNDDLAESKRFGFFTGMSDKGLFQTDTGRAKYARTLTTAEIAQCY